MPLEYKVNKFKLRFGDLRRVTANCCNPSNAGSYICAAKAQNGLRQEEELLHQVTCQGQWWLQQEGMVV